MIEPAYGWAIQYNYRNAPGGFVSARFYMTRKGAIADYDSLMGGTGAYRRERRKGRVLAVRVKMCLSHTKEP